VCGAQTKGVPTAASLLSAARATAGRPNERRVSHGRVHGHAEGDEGEGDDDDYRPESAGERASSEAVSSAHECSRSGERAREERFTSYPRWNVRARAGESALSTRRRPTRASAVPSSAPRAAVRGTTRAPRVRRGVRTSSARSLARSSSPHSRQSVRFRRQQRHQGE